MALAPRRPRCEFRAVVVLAASVVMLAGSPTFLWPVISMASSATSLETTRGGSLRGGRARDLAASTIHSDSRGGSAGALRVMAMVAAMLLAVATTPLAHAGLLDEFGKIDYDNEKKVIKYTESRAEVLEDAAKKAKQQEKKLQIEAKQKAKAAEQLLKLEQKKEAEKAAKAKAAADVKAQPTKTAEEQAAEARKKAAEQELEEKQEQLRAKILTDLEKRKVDAAKAAADAEAIAIKIEQLAKEARAAAELAKQLAVAS